MYKFQSGMLPKAFSQYFNFQVINMKQGMQNKTIMKKQESVMQKKNPFWST